MLPLEILFEDHHLLAVNKPAPLLTQGPAGVPSLESLVKAYIKEKYAKPAGVYLGIPHRLDRPVSGVIVFARNTKAAQRLHQQFHDRLVEKKYHAIVEGVVGPDVGEWVNYLRKLSDESRTEIASEGDPDAKEATTMFRVLERYANFTLLELTPKTGRSHQLRVQAAAHGHPIWGDAWYGGCRALSPESEAPRDRLIALHAASLRIAHPFGKPMPVLVAPTPTWWRERMNKNNEQ